MKKLFLLTYTFLLTTLLFGEELKSIKDFGSNPGELKLYIQPAKQANAPIVVLLHGCNQTASSLLRTSGWDKLAEELDLFLILPEQKRKNNGQRCFNWFKKSDCSLEEGEAASILEMINFCKKECNLSTSKCYIVGFSAGAQMTVNLISMQPQLFESAAVFGAGPYTVVDSPSKAVNVMKGNYTLNDEEFVELVRQKNPGVEHYPNLYIHQGLKDPIVNPTNALLLCKQWGNLKKLTQEITQEDFKRLGFISRKEINDSTGLNKVVLYLYEGVGHTLLIDEGDSISQGGKKGIFSVDKNFWSARQVVADFQLLKNEH
jgi:poly(hydroxyalkanoate) depolymerase family esterase